MGHTEHPKGQLLNTIPNAPVPPLPEQASRKPPPAVGGGYACYEATTCLLRSYHRPVTIFGMVHFKHTHTRHPKTLLLAYWVPKYVRLGRHIKAPPFVASSLSNTLLPGIQKLFFLAYLVHRYARLKRHPKPPHFFGVVPFRHPQLRCPTTLLLPYLVQRYEACGAGAKPHFFGMAHFKHPNARYTKTTLLPYLVPWDARLERHTKPPHFLALRISNIPILGIQRHLCCHSWCRGMRA